MSSNSALTPALSIENQTSSAPLVRERVKAVHLIVQRPLLSEHFGDFSILGLCRR